MNSNVSEYLKYDPSLDELYKYSIDDLSKVLHQKLVEEGRLKEKQRLEKIEEVRKDFEKEVRRALIMSIIEKSEKIVNVDMFNHDTYVHFTNEVIKCPSESEIKKIEHDIRKKLIAKEKYYNLKNLPDIMEVVATWN